ncbi:hypothetical protein [Actinomadura chokoriensis]|uniref:Uncharacterized protein n=1 Tax=Actinomadura chokoriensis TaxID=454156 RepID=A0ABV4QZF1_9ACTN
MTGRHRGQPKIRAAEDEVEERASRGGRRALVAAAFVVPVLVVSAIVFGMGEEPVRERPQTAGARVQAVEPATPGSEPTYGKYVPPETGPQAATKAPEREPAPVTRPRKTVAPTPSPTKRAQRPCPAGWEDVWWMRRWCERHGYHDR